MIAATRALKQRAVSFGAGFALLGVLMAPAPALALAHGTLTFDQASGTANGNENIPVYFSFHLDSDSDALQTGPGGVPILGGPSDQELTDAGFDVSQDYSIALTVSFTCSGTFTAGGCTNDGTPYTFDFNYNAFSFIGGEVDLAPGDSIQNVLFGTFMPIGGFAPGGDYTFYQAAVLFSASQTLDGEDERYASFDLASTCISGDDSCAFTRTVTPVPEPGEWAMMIAGLGIVAGAARRRSGRVSA